MPQGREHIPATVKRAVLVEAGHLQQRGRTTARMHDRRQRWLPAELVPTWYAPVVCIQKADSPQIRRGTMRRVCLERFGVRPAGQVAAEPLAILQASSSFDVGNESCPFF
jgi:hypothetical protein